MDATNKSCSSCKKTLPPSSFLANASADLGSRVFATCFRCRERSRSKRRASQPLGPPRPPPQLLPTPVATHPQPLLPCPTPVATHQESSPLLPLLLPTCLCLSHRSLCQLSQSRLRAPASSRPNNGGTSGIFTKSWMRYGWRPVAGTRSVGLPWI